MSGYSLGSSRGFMARSKSAAHLLFAWYAMLRYGYPSRDLYVIGVTGTSGKSSVVVHLRTMLEAAGFRVGSISTVDICIGKEKILNTKKMTMLGRGETQRYLKRMVKEGCDIAIVETSSQGVLQHRHRGILYDAVILTNFYSEHIEAHGSYEAYRAAKVAFFQYVAKSHRKISSGLSDHLKSRFARSVPKVCIVNGDVIPNDLQPFLDLPFDETYLVHRRDKIGAEVIAKAHGKIHDLFVANIKKQNGGVSWTLRGTPFTASLRGEFEPMNVSLAVSALFGLHEEQNKIQETTKATQPVPGRIEFIKEAKTQGFDVIVDYAFEPVAVKALYDTIRGEYKRILHVFGSTGGGRDKARRFTVGEMVGHEATLAYVTDEDPYDDNPMDIMQDVATGLKSGGKKEGTDFFIIPDRKEAIERAIREAGPGDVVLITGKGSEQAMVVKGTLIPWDDRQVAKDAITALEKG